MSEILFYLILFTGYIAVVHTAITDTEYIKINSRGNLFCKHNVTTEDLFYSVKWFKSSRDDVFENDDPAVLSWDGTSQPYSTGNYDIDTAFSLVIFNTSIQDEGVYQCYITLPKDPYELMHNVKLKVYALPSKAPLIQRVNDTFFNCSVDRVYPLLYPQVEFEHDNSSVQNTDGTYNTSVSGSIQNIQSRLNAVDCSFSYFNYSQVSSLSLYPTTTIPIVKDKESDITTPTDLTTLEIPDQGTKGNSRKLIVSLLSAAAAAVVIGVICVVLLLARRKSKKNSRMETCKENGLLKTSTSL